jgi:hypothetical protein
MREVTMGMKTYLEQMAALAHVFPGRLLQMTRPAKVLGGILFLALVFNSGQIFGAGQSVTLAWNPSSDPNAAGYNIYYGGTSRSYTNMLDAGNVTSTTISGLTAGATYYFAATTYDSIGRESGYSGEASYVVPATSSSLQIRRTPAGQFVLTVTGPAGQTRQIQATQDFKVWTVIGTVVVGAGGSTDFTDTNTASFQRRFYRVQ